MRLKVVSEGDTVIAVGKLYGCDTIAGYGVIESGENYLDKQMDSIRPFYTDVAGDISGSGVLVNIRGEVIGIINTSVRQMIRQIRFPDMEFLISKM